jgi:hypothetical protein
VPEGKFSICRQDAGRYCKHLIELGVVEDTTMRVSIMLMNFRKWLLSKRFHGRQQRKVVFTCP